MKISSTLLGSVLSHKINESSGTDVESIKGIFTEYDVNNLAGLNLFEGDIETDNGISGQNIMMDLSYRWPQGLIKFDVGTDVTPNVVGVFHQAIRELELKSIIHFKHRDNETDYISLYKGGGCSSQIGRRGGRQTISLASGCDRMATIMHEFTHASGLLHAQSRPDRDDYVEIMWDNIQKGY